MQFCSVSAETDVERWDKKKIANGRTTDCAAKRIRKPGTSVERSVVAAMVLLKDEEREKVQVSVTFHVNKSKSKNKNIMRLGEKLVKVEVVLSTRQHKDFDSSEEGDVRQGVRAV